VLIGALVGYGSAATRRACMPSSTTFRSCCSDPGPRPFLIGALVEPRRRADRCHARRAQGGRAAARGGDASTGTAAVQAFDPRRGGSRARARPADADHPAADRAAGRAFGFVTSFGIGMSVAVLVTSMQWLDAIDYMVDIYFRQAQVQDITVSFTEPRSERRRRERWAGLPGVRAVEPMRSVPAKMRVGSASSARRCRACRRTRSCTRSMTPAGRHSSCRPEGVVISTMLGQLLHVKPAATCITVEVLEGRRPGRASPSSACSRRTSARRPTWRSVRSRGC
jgi:hypothetical protein